jgi:hypothetical protein
MLSRSRTLNLPNEVESLCLSLREQLGFIRLSMALRGCAVFPALRLPLTIHLGNELAKAAGRGSPTEVELLSICRLPWFRTGWMPDDIRSRLVPDLANQFRTPVRHAIEHFLFLALDRPPHLGLAAPGFERAQPPRNWRPILRSWLSLSRPDGSRPDDIFFCYMTGRNTSELPLRIDAALARRFGRRISVGLEPRTLIAFVLAAVSAIVLWLYADKLTPTSTRGEAIPAQTTTHPEPGVPATRSTPELTPELKALIPTVQAALGAVGCRGLTVDGVFGPQTRACLREYQAKNNLAVTGELDSATLNSLFVMSGRHK